MCLYLCVCVGGGGGVKWSGANDQRARKGAAVFFSHCILQLSVFTVGMRTVLFVVCLFPGLTVASQATPGKKRFLTTSYWSKVF